MASGQTPRRRPASRSGEPAAGVQADGATDALAAEGSSIESVTGQRKPVARRTARSSAGNAANGAAASRRLAAAAAAAAAAGAAAMVNTSPESTPPAFATPVLVSGAASSALDPDIATDSAVAAVSEAIAATAATKAKRSAGAKALAAATTPEPVASANPPVTVEGYVRAPGRDVAGLTRAHHNEPKASAAPDDPTRKYMRPSPEVPGITRAAPAAEEAPAESARPAPLFSNEGIVRQYEARYRGRIPGPLAGIFTAVLAAGTILGHELSGAKSAVTRGGFGKTRVSGGSALAQVSGSPDFDRNGNMRSGRGRRRAAGAMALVGVMGVAIFAVAMTSVLPPPPSNSIPAGSPAATSNGVIADVASPSIVDPTVEPTTAPTSVLVGDESLARRPTAKPGTTGTPKPGASVSPIEPGASPTATATPGQTLPPGSTPAPTPDPTATRTPTPTPVPTPTPPPPPAPTPAPTAAPAFPTVDTELTNILPAGTDFNFHVFYVTGSSCYLTRTYIAGSTPHPSPTPRSPLSSSRFTIIGSNADSGPVPWGANAPFGTYTIRATCSSSGGDKTSPGITVIWQ
jgi:hypothetical protein